MQKIWQGYEFQTYFCFFKKLYLTLKQVVCSLVSKNFYSPQLDIQSKQTAQNFRILIQRYAQFWFFRKESGKSFFTAFCVCRFKKNDSDVIFMLYSFLSSDCLQFLRYQAICALQLFVLSISCDVKTKS